MEGAFRPFSQDRFTFCVLLFAAFVCVVKFTSEASHTAHTDVREYCNDEHFSVNCTEGSVVVVNSAVYGSMRKGNCLRSHSIVDGCGTSVLPALDSLCSGRQSCHFRVPNDELRRARNCSKEIALYLEASYSCITVESGSTCRNGVNIPDGSLSPAALQWGAEGHLGNFHRPEKCRWTLTAARGLRVRLSLFDFGTGLWQTPSMAAAAAAAAAAATSGAWYGASDRGCRVYASVREAAAPAVAAAAAARGAGGFDVCGGNRRIVEDFYESKSHSIEVETFHVQNAEKKQVHFVLKFKVVGCSDPIVGNFATVRREGNNATVVCSTTNGARYFLECRENVWVGERPVCSQDDAAASMGQGWSLRSFWPDGWSSSQGVIIVIMIGVGLGVLFGVLMLAPVLVYFKRRDLDRYVKTPSWPEHPLGGSGPQGPVPTDYSGLPVHDLQRKVIRASADSGPVVNESSVYEEDRKRVYELRGSGPGALVEVGPTTQDPCFVMTTAGCRWATAKRIVAQEICKDNSGDYEYPH